MLKQNIIKRLVIDVFIFIAYLFVTNVKQIYEKDSVIDEIILFCFYSLLLSCPVLSVEIPIADGFCQMTRKYLFYSFQISDCTGNF